MYTKPKLFTETCTYPCLTKANIQRPKNKKSGCITKEHVRLLVFSVSHRFLHSIKPKTTTRVIKYKYKYKYLSIYLLLGVLRYRCIACSAPPLFRNPISRIMFVIFYFILLNCRILYLH